VTVVGDAVDVTDAEGSKSVTGGRRCNAKQQSNLVTENNFADKNVQ
jgi:hypothetical protein